MALVAFIYTAERQETRAERVGGGHAAMGHRLGVEPATAAGGLDPLYMDCLLISNQTTF